jgi:two-component system response regulator HydG
VRELRNVLERASLMCDSDVIGVEHLDEELRIPAETADADVQRQCSEERVPRWEELERRSFMQVVLAHRGSRKALAEKLGLSERTLYRKLRQYQQS